MHGKTGIITMTVSPLLHAFGGGEAGRGGIKKYTSSI